LADRIPLLVIGAGPYGLAMSAYAARHHIAHIIAGIPMEFWKSHMPRDLLLRSGVDWHLDPFDEHTIERYLKATTLRPAAGEPLSRDFYLGYCGWFQEQKGIRILPKMVRSLNYAGGTSLPFQAVFEDGETIAARSVVLALGFRYFRNVPDAYTSLFPRDRIIHSCDCVQFESLKGKRVLIIGGRQSAFEWAALLHEHGASAVYLSYPHPTPAFKPSDWSWVNPLVDAMVSDPGWFRRLPAEGKEELSRRMWAEGRLKLEPWLAPRLATETIRLFPQSRVVAGRELSSGELEAELDDGATLTADQIVLATGYRVEVTRVPLLAGGNLLARLATKDGFPVLDEYFQSSLPGLFFTSMCATQDFGPFFAFTAGVRTSAALVGSALKGLLNGARGSK
jgi:cation diffusion facilitator CzcD-associated flavoprotein CzcO